MNRYIFLLFLFNILLHIFIFNINSAEWGDSYRILRAGEYIRNFSYPAEEKRPPAYSALLAIRPASVDQVFWGRSVMFLLNILTLFIFWKFCALIYSKDKKVQYLSLILFILNPVFLYWSIRIMADAPFALLALLGIYILTKHKQSLTIYTSVLLGLIAGVSVLTRFEGYLLFAAMLAGIVYADDSLHVNLSKLLTSLLQRIKFITIYLLSFAAVVLPYFYFRNPFNSAYLDEPSGRTYDLKMLLIYTVSLIFLFGFVYGTFFALKSGKSFFRFFSHNPAVGVFVLMELALILLWPAAIPRLFVAVIPFLIIPLSKSVIEYFDTVSTKSTLKDMVFLAALAGLYALAQFYLKLQFLVPIKEVLVVLVVFQVVVGVAIFYKKLNFFVLVLFVSALTWSYATIWLHKDIFKVIKEASVYASENFNGTVGYNDVSSVADWYFNQKQNNDMVRGVFYSYSKKSDLDFDKLKEKQLDYLLLTNEHNTDMTLDLSTRPYLTEVKEFKYVIRGKEFFTKIVKINKT